VAPSPTRDTGISSTGQSTVFVRFFSSLMPLSSTLLRTLNAPGSQRPSGWFWHASRPGRAAPHNKPESIPSAISSPSRECQRLLVQPRPCTLGCLQSGRDTIASISASSASVSCHPAAATLDFTCSDDVAPAITDATAGRSSSHERASSRMVCPRDSENSISFSTTVRFRFVSKLSPLLDRRRLPSGACWSWRYFPVSSPLASGK
jgi:hypothetical protein